MKKSSNVCVSGYTRGVSFAIPSGAPPAARAAYLLARIGRTQATRFAERVGTVGLRPKHFALLNAIALADGASQQELGGHLGLDPSGLVGAIDELERMGLVERGRDPADRRRYALAHRDAPPCPPPGLRQRARAARRARRRRGRHAGGAARQGRGGDEARALLTARGRVLDRRGAAG
jgi:DNA-binding transcriptional ArsR family regulator